MASFADRVVLITGAASGIGRQLSCDLAAAGAAVALVDKEAEPLAQLEKHLVGRKVAAAVADVTDRPGLRGAIDRLAEQLGPIDLLIANAGIGRETTALTFRADEIAAHVQVNFLGVVNSIEAVLDGMIQRQAGHLVAMSSLASYRGFPRMAGYCASKAAVNALMDSCRLELRPLGIAVTTICPGWIRTPLTTNLSLAPDMLMDLKEASRRILWAIRQKRPFYAFPSHSARLCRWLRWLPCGLSDRLTMWGVDRMLEKK